MATRIRLRPRARGTVPTPVPPSDWDDEQGTCPNCKAIIYGAGKCCDGIYSKEAFAATMDASNARHGA